MKIMTSGLIAASLILLDGAGATAHSQSGRHAPIAASSPPEAHQASVAVDAFHAALKRGDADAAAALLDDTAVIYEEGEVEQSKAAYAASHLPADIGFVSSMTETVTHRSTGASAGMAWVATEGRVVGRYHDKMVDRQTTETMVLRRTSMGWRIVHIHWSSKVSAG